MADTKISNLAAVTDVQATDEFVLARAGTTNKIDASDLRAAGLAIHNAYALLREEQAANTQSGTFTSGAWQTRVLNTESFDPAGIVTLSGNQFTLQAGTYLIRGRAPGFDCGRHKCKLVNVTDTTDVGIGSSSYGSTIGDGQTDSFVIARVTIASAKAFSLQHRCDTTKASQGFGVEDNLGVIEVYAEVEIWREA